MLWYVLVFNFCYRAIFYTACLVIRAKANCSTGFSVIRAKESISNQYLHFMLRSPLVREQFRKFSTGSSYPAILDEDIKKTVIPLPEQPIQDQIAEKVHNQTLIRNQKITTANKEWSEKLSEYMAEIEKL